MKWIVRISAVAVLLWWGDAEVASTSLILNFTSPPSTSVNCTINYPSGQTSFVVPVAVGTQVAVCAVTPTGWQGQLTLSGADASFFTISGNIISVDGATITNPRTY